MRGRTYITINRSPALTAYGRLPFTGAACSATSIPMGGIPTTPEALMLQARQIPPDSTWEVIGIGRGQWRQVATALVLGALFLRHAIRMRFVPGDLELPMKTFKFSITYLGILFAALLIDHYFLFQLNL